MIVQHNMNALNSYNRLNFNVTSMKKSAEKLSSGYRINRAGDDAAGLAISEKMRSQIRGLNQAKRNAQDGISMIQTYEGALTETHSILQRMKELAAESANGTYDDATDRAAIQLEFDQLNDELDQIADTDFNGVMALNGGTQATKSTVSIPNTFGGAKATLTTTTSITLQVGARSKDAVNFTFKYTSKGIGSLTADLNVSSTGLKTKDLKLSTAKDANLAIDQIDFAINKTSMVRATFGSVQNRLEHKIENLTATAENMTEAEAGIRDTDMASEMMNYTKYNILQQAAQSMLAQANQQPQSILQLLG
ncbi:MAG: flagellin [Oscillospiraceae bacterium]|nr:flagellin [Oscillospiraceae bacterium]